MRRVHADQAEMEAHRTFVLGEDVVLVPVASIGDRVRHLCDDLAGVDSDVCDSLAFASGPAPHVAEHVLVQREQELLVQDRHRAAPVCLCVCPWQCLGDVFVLDLVEVRPRCHKIGNQSGEILVANWRGASGLWTDGRDAERPERAGCLAHSAGHISLRSMILRT
jgi:hypothetical protein